MNKPTCRWTLGGKVNPRAITCLKMSIKSFYNLYGDDFDYYVMWNGLPALPDFTHFPFINTIDQKLHSDSLPYPPWDCCWKLYPPRLDVSAPEIWMDNDFILVKKIPEIDDLIYKNIPFMTQGLMRNYGRYNSQVKNYNLNCGFFGLPTGFDFATTIKEICRRDIEKRWVDHYDDQGMIAATMCRFPKFNMIPLNRIPIIGAEKPDCPKDKDGYHFVYLNRFNLKHLGWNSYNKQLRNKIKVI